MDNIDCQECNKPVFSEIERDLHICNRCADRQYERHTRRREFEYYHNDEENNAKTTLR